MYISATELSALYRVQKRPQLEYCCQVWSAADPTTLALLNADQKRSIRLINDTNITGHWEPLSYRSAVADIIVSFMDSVPRFPQYCPSFLSQLEKLLSTIRSHL